MVWDQTLETGDEAIDEQHRRIVSLIHEVDVADSDGGLAHVQKVLEELTDYVAVHFAMEEDLMRREGYPEVALASHEAEHRDFTEIIRNLVLQYRRGGIADISAITDVLRRWLSHHIHDVDRVMADHIRAVRSEGRDLTDSGMPE